MEMLPIVARLEGSRKSPVPTMLVTTSDDAPTRPIFFPPPPCIVVPSVLDALDVVLAVLHFDAVGVVAEARERVVPSLQRFQVADPGTVRGARGFARHHHRDAGRVGHHAGSNRATGELR